MKRAIALISLIFSMMWGSVIAQDDNTASLLITPASQGIFELNNAQTWLGYGTVRRNLRLNIETHPSGLDVRFQPSFQSTLLPMIIEHDEEIYITDQSGVITPLPQGDFLIYFDTVAVYAQHLTEPDRLFSVGMLENFTPSLPVQRRKNGYDVSTSIQTNGRRILSVISPNGEQTDFETASQIPRYREQFMGQALEHPATLQFLGWTSAEDLPAIIKAMYSDLAPETPLHGQTNTNLPLVFPFDCQYDWTVTWGYHGSTAQNRYALDFAAIAGIGGTQGLPVYAAHPGTLFLKVLGYDDELIELGITAKVVHEDGIRATQYGHLAPQTFAFWDVEPNSPFEWIMIKDVHMAEQIGFAGATGYGTGAHIHFAAWRGDQSIDRPVFGWWRDLQKGSLMLAQQRPNCGSYR